jgi:hypothetical protein
MRTGEFGVLSACVATRNASVLAAFADRHFADVAGGVNVRDVPAVVALASPSLVSVDHFDSLGAF